MKSNFKLIFGSILNLAWASLFAVLTSFCCSQKGKLYRNQSSYYIFCQNYRVGQQVFRIMDFSDDLVRH